MTVEEYCKRYNLKTLDEVMERLSTPRKRMVDSTLSLFDEDREQEEFIEQCRRELEARVKAINSTQLTEAQAMESIHLLTEEELEKRGWKRCTFDEIPRIKIDCNIEEYAKANGYLSQEEFNERINNAIAIAERKTKHEYDR